MKLTIDEVAMLAHEANRAYCKAIGDDSQLPWEQSPGWQQKSATMGVQVIMNNPEVTPEQLHESWLKQKVEEGWVYGEVKDVVTKTHPCILPYSELPLAQRTKDYIFGGVVRSALGIRG